MSKTKVVKIQYIEEEDEKLNINLIVDRNNDIKNSIKEFLWENFIPTEFNDESISKTTKNEIEGVYYKILIKNIEDNLNTYGDEKDEDDDYVFDIESIIQNISLVPTYLHHSNRLDKLHIDEDIIEELKTIINNIVVDIK